MRRRDLALGVAGLASLSVLPLGRLWAQDAGQLPKVAILAVDTPDYADRPTSTVRQVLAALTELGYIDGQNVSFEFRFAHNAYERLPGLAAELVAWQPDVLWTWTSGAGRAAASATSSIPIVLAPVAEATMAALVADFGRPPGNITGLTITNLQLEEKGLQLLKETVPDIKRVGVLLNLLNPIWHGYPELMNGAARALDIELVRVEARGVAEVGQAFASMAAQKVDAVFGLTDATLIGGEPTPPRILELLASHRLPAASDEPAFAREGGLLSVAADFPALLWGAAEYIDRILQGAKVADLPVVLPSKFILAVNLKTAEQLGITIPPSILLRADEVIE
jgi:putative tryptophan/tyrosine transport system substrate-binding protein